MARTDRLMRLMDVMRRVPQPVTAQRLAVETDISLRQLYRDIATLRAGGAQIDGVAGLGYTLTEDPALPPQSFSRLEIEALMMAVNGLDQVGDAALALAGRTALGRIIATLPDRQSRQAMHTILRNWRPQDERPPVTVDMDLLRRACWEEVSLRIDYRDLQNRQTTRDIWPLSLSYSQNALMLLAHCQLRQGFRMFHVSRIEAATQGDQSFRPHRVRLLREFAESLRRSPPSDRAVDGSSLGPEGG